MKASEFRKLIREEVRKMVNESIKTTIDWGEGPAKFNKLFGEFLTVPSGIREVPKGEFMNYDSSYKGILDLDKLINKLETDSRYSAQINQDTQVWIYFKGNDAVVLEGLPKDVVATLGEYEKSEPSKNLISIQIGDEGDNFEFPDEYRIPTALKAVVGKSSITADPEDEDLFDQQVTQYLKKIEKTLLAAGKKIVPGMKKYTMEDGFIIFDLPTEPTPQIKNKLKQLYKGAIAVGF